MLGPSPYALPAVQFPLRALAQAAARAPLGGPRESILATLLGARLAIALLHRDLIDHVVRAARADAARAWIGTIAIPAVPKAAVTRLIEASAKGDATLTAAALAKVTEVTAPYLDKAARSELMALGAALTGSPAAQIV